MWQAADGRSPMQSHVLGATGERVQTRGAANRIFSARGMTDADVQKMHKEKCAVPSCCRRFRPRAGLHVDLSEGPVRDPLNDAAPRD